MTHTRKERIYWIAAISALAATLIVLAVLQYRWSRELDEAASTRMRANLQASMVGFRIDLARELSNLAQALRVDPEAPLSAQASDYTRQLQEWQRSSAHPDLVANIYLLRTSEAGHRQLLRLDSRANTFVNSEWPESFASLKDSVAQNAPEGVVIAPFGRHANAQREHPHGPFPELWEFELQIPALIRTDVRARFAPDERSAPAPRERAIIELNRTVLRDQILPELTEHFFGGSNGLTYDVAIIERGQRERLIFSSGSQLGSNPSVNADARINLFGPPFGSAGSPNHLESHPAPPPEDRLFARQERGFVLRLDPFRNMQQRGTWELLAKHHKGSLEAALASSRRQHLAFSFGTLLILTATIAMVIVATRRAQLLAKQQMEFVAGVSHELRTPLAVITSAAENIADGIVTNPTKLVQYGAVIRKHSRQLTQLVEQVLQFSAGRNGGNHYTLSPTRPEELIETALYRSSELLSSGGFSVERQIAPNLPEVLVDSSAVSQCLENLITNAIKYSGDSKSIRVIAAQSRDRNHELLITVEDRGIGISHAELRRIFDPFYRSPEVVSAQIRGTGLGLALARSIAESMGGRLTVTSDPGKGSAFTLHLPVATEATIKPSTATANANASGAENDESANSDC